VNISDSPTVIIPTAGLGSRLGDISKFINKALLPYDNKPVLSHIIEQFPDDTKFIIPLGYKQEQIVDFCELTYPEKNIEFVHVPNYIEDFTGPGYTIKCCLENINSAFFYIPCDSYFVRDFNYVYENDVYFVKNVDQTMNQHYTTFLLENDLIKDLQFKQNTSANYTAFTGVMYIKDYLGFKERLVKLQSPEIIYTITLDSRVKFLNSWIDFGNLEVYKDVVNQLGKYDFTKNDEITYITNNKVIKYWTDNTIANKKHKKYLTNPKVYPSNVKYKNNWLTYDYFSGTTLYCHDDITCFDSYLKWLDEDVWIQDKNKDIKTQALSFYKNKTIERVNKFLKKYPDLTTVTHINDVEVKDFTYYLNSIDWEMLINDVLPSFTHGDLHFDNTIISSNNTYKVIDWRHEFGDIIEYGDIYYDLAKLYGGFVIDYSKIKENTFKLEYKDSKVYLEIPHAKNYEFYLKSLTEFIKNKNYNIKKVKLLVPIIYWNMSPLHTDPFDKFCWYLGILMFQELHNENFL